jgi:7-carboxy-7-deazaguanine synthase
VQELFWTRANEIKLVVSTGEEVDFYHKHLENNVKIPVFLQPEWNSKELSNSHYFGITETKS